MSIKIEKFEIVPYVRKPGDYVCPQVRDGGPEPYDSILKFIFTDETGTGKYAAFMFPNKEMTIKKFCEFIHRIMQEVIYHI